MDEPTTGKARRRSRGMVQEIALTLAGLAVIWFAIVTAAAYVIGPIALCHAAFPDEVCGFIVENL